MKIDAGAVTSSPRRRRWRSTRHQTSQKLHSFPIPPSQLASGSALKSTFKSPFKSTWKSAWSRLRSEFLSYLPSWLYIQLPTLLSWWRMRCPHLFIFSQVDFKVDFNYQFSGQINSHLPWKLTWIPTLISTLTWINHKLKSWLGSWLGMRLPSSNLGLEQVDCETFLNLHFKLSTSPHFKQFKWIIGKLT